MHGFDSSDEWNPKWKALIGDVYEIALTFMRYDEPFPEAMQAAFYACASDDETIDLSAEVE